MALSPLCGLSIAAERYVSSTVLSLRERPLPRALHRMPLTFSHPAAVLPLFGLRKLVSPSALIIGSMMPDLTYFIPGLPEGALTHSVRGLFVFCLPAGLAIYLLFHLLMKHPLIALLPPAFEQRLVPHETTRIDLTLHALLIVCISLVVGAVTHIAWDSFTHEWGWPVLHSQWLRTTILVFRGTPIFGYRVLQYISSVFGLVVMAWWIYRWRMSAPLHPMPADANRRGVRTGFIAVILLLSLGAAWMKVASYGYDLHHVSGFRAQYLVFKAITAGASTFFSCMLAYCVLWQLGLFHRRAAG